MNHAAILGEQGPRWPLLVAAVTTAIAALLSYALPDAYAGTGVGMWFLAVVYFCIWHSAPSDTLREFGLALGGVFEPEPLELRGLLAAAGSALGWALGAAVLIFPAFAVGYRLWYHPHQAFALVAPAELGGEALGQVLGVAFPEEAFFRGYLQSALDRAWPPTQRWFGAMLGPGLLVSSAIFALGHLLTEPAPGRLAVFFPALVFGYLRARTGGIGASLAFHALCNLFAWYLGRSYGLVS